MIEAAYKLIKHHEGYREYPYNDRTGERHVSPVGKLTIGYGWNLEDQPLPKEISERLLQYGVAHATKACFDSIDRFMELSANRKAALISMAFNLGRRGFRSFKRMIAAVNRRDWETAAEELLDSRYAREQVPNRARDLADILRTGRLRCLD